MSWGVVQSVAAQDDVGFRRRLQLNEIRTYDGSRNNVDNPDWGTVGSALRRMAQADYPGDGSGETILESPDRPNPREVSNRLVDQQLVDMPSARQLSDFSWLWGQFIDHDLDLTFGAPEFGEAPIPVPDGDELGPRPIPFSRSEFAVGTGTPAVPREQVNSITAYLDGSCVYGSSKVRADALRTFSGGRMKTSDGNLLPFNLDGLDNAGGPSSELFLAGDVRANENVALSAVHTLFVREHNRLARLVATASPDATDEEIYQLVRKVIAAELQIITYREFLPALVDNHRELRWDQAEYDPSIDASIRNEFSTALYRMGHSMLSGSLQLGRASEDSSIALSDAFFNPAFLSEQPSNLDLLFVGAAERVCQQIDIHLVEDVRSFLFGPPGAGGLDLSVLNMQRGRDHGLPDYNAMRESYGLLRVSTFAEISSSAEVQAGLEELYGSVDNIDAWVGALAEDHVPNASVGPLVMAGLVDQFARVREGDRLFWVNDPDLRQPVVRAVVNLESMTLAKVVRANTRINVAPRNCFIVGGQTERGVDLTLAGEGRQRAYLIGNEGDDSLFVWRFSFGVLVATFGGTDIDGSSMTFLPAFFSDLDLTIDLGGGDNQLIYWGGVDDGDLIPDSPSGLMSLLLP